MIYLKLFLYIVIIVFFYLDTNSISMDNNEKHFVTSELCWPEVDKARSILETFITQPNWESERNDTGTDGLSTSQIQLLTDSQFSQICQDLNTKYSQTISTKAGSNNDPKYDFVYYKVENFYFAVIILAPSSDPDEVVMGLSFISIYDNNLNRLTGYSL